MWLCTKHGFYSIVQKRDGFHVRARTRRDLENLIAVTKLEFKIEEWPAADYRWRFRVFNLASIRSVFAALLDSITYENFKSEVYSRADQHDKRSAYNRLWQALADVQEEAREETEP